MKARKIIIAKLEINMLELVVEFVLVVPLLLVPLVGGGVTVPVQFKGQVLVAVQSSQPKVTVSYTNPQIHLVQCKPSVAAQAVLIQDCPLGPK